MTEKESPWRQTKNIGSLFPLGLLLWLGLFLFISILAGALFIFFPDQTFSEDTYLEVARLFGIFVLVSSGLIYARKFKFGEVARNASIWISIVGVLLLGYTYRPELSAIIYRVGGELIPGLPVPSGTGELIITASRDGHFYVNGKANGKRLRFMVDTGASDITLSPRAASRIGIDLRNLQFTQRYRTANGIGLGAPYRLRTFSIGSFDFSDIKISINQVKMTDSLLGMAFLERLQSFEFKGDKLYLRK